MFPGRHGGVSITIYVPLIASIEIIQLWQHVPLIMAELIQMGTLMESVLPAVEIFDWIRQKCMLNLI